MIGAWIVENLIRINVQGLQQMERLAASQSAADIQFARLTGNITAQEAAMLRYANSVKKAHESQRAMLTTVAAGGAIVLAAGLAYAAKNAGDLQTAITGVQIATHRLDPKAFREYSRLALQTSGITAQDTVTVAQEMATAASSGLNDPTKLHDAFTRIAKAADVLWMSPKHTDPVESVRTMSQLAHLFGVYEGKPLQHMLDRAVEMQFVQPEAIQQLVTQGRLFLPSAMSAGVSEEDIWKQAMTMGQTGFLRSRGGSGLANVIEALAGATALTGHLSRAQRTAMGQLGLTGADGRLASAFHDAKGNLLLQKVVDHLEAVRHNTEPTTFLAEVTNAFQKQGGRYMSDILIPTIYQKAQQNWEMMNKMGGVDKTWGQYSDNFLYQWRVFTTNLKNLFTVVALPMLPGLTEFFRLFGQGLGYVVLALADHPGAAGALGYLALGMATFLGVVGTVGGVAAALRFLGIIDELPNAFLVTISPISWLVRTIGGLTVAQTAAGEVLTVSAALRTLAGAGVAFMASPFGKMLSLAGVIMGTTSFDPTSAAAKWRQYINQSGGPNDGYSKYLRMHGINAGNFQNNLSKPGVLSPSQFWDSRHPWQGFGKSGGTQVSFSGAHITFEIHDATDPKKVAQIVAELFGNPLHLMATSGYPSRTAAHIPLPLAVRPA